MLILPVTLLPPPERKKHPFLLLLPVISSFSQGKKHLPFLLLLLLVPVTETTILFSCIEPRYDEIFIYFKLILNVLSGSILVWLMKLILQSLEAQEAEKALLCEAFYILGALFSAAYPSKKSKSKLAKLRVRL